MTIQKAHQLFNKFVVVWNDAAQKTEDIYYDMDGNFPECLLPADKSILVEAFNLLIADAKFIGDNDQHDYKRALLLLDRFVPTRR